MGEGILYGAIFLISFLIYLSILIWIESYSAKEKTNKGSEKNEVQWRTLTYTELLDSEEWRRNREDILSRIALRKEFTRLILHLKKGGYIVFVITMNGINSIIPHVRLLLI